MAKDKEKEEQDKKEKEKVEEKKVGFFDKVPVFAKIGGAAVLLWKFLEIRNRGGELNEMSVWAFAVLAVWYMWGSAGKKVDTGILTRKEAVDLLRKEIEIMKRDGEIEPFSQVFIGPNIGLFHSEGMPQHYQIGVEIVEEDHREYKRGIVYAKGDTKGYVTIQDNLGKLTGREPIPTKYPIPTIMRKANKQLDIDFDRMLGLDKK